MTESTPRQSFVRRVGREPVVHFAGAALLLFGIAELADTLRPEVVEIDPREIEWRVQQLERGQGAVLGDEERARAEQAYIDEQILAREARARGLDDDQRIRSILSQKMLHVLSGGAIQPTEAELRAYYEKHTARYARPPSVNAEAIVVSGGGSGVGAPELDNVLDRSILTGVSRNDLALAFGEDVATSVFQAESGEWVGPYRAASGDRWFQIREVIEAGPPPPFEALLGQLRYDWIGEREAELLQDRLVELRQRYSVRLTTDHPER